MFKKLGLSLLIVMLGLHSSANEIPIKVYAPIKITTSTPHLQEGDTVEFLVSKDIYLNSKLYINKDEKIEGVVTSIEPNGFGCKEAVIYVENFKSRNVDGKQIKISGIICKRGRTHWMFTQIIPGLSELIKGGEVQIKPNESFNLYLEDRL